jgi:hypothetical protein
MKISHVGLALAVLAIACGGTYPSEEPGAGDKTAVVREKAIQGLRWRGGVEPSGLVQVQTLAPGETYPQVHTGLVVAKDPTAGYQLILTSDRWVQSSMSPSTVTVVDDPTVHGPSRPGRYINDSDFFPGAVVQVADFSPSLAPLDSRASADLVGRGLRCFEYSNPTTLQYVDVRVTSSDGDTLTAAYSPDQNYNVPQYLEYWDAGAMCRDWITGAFVAFVTDANTVRATLHRIAGLSTWLGHMQNLARVRTRYGNARVAFYNNLSRRMCGDIPWGSPFSGEAINQYPCHYGPSQRFWLDYTIDANHPRLVSDASGRCADVPGSTTGSGSNLQQYDCHAGANQRFEFSLWGDSSGGWKVRPVSGLSANLCLGVEGGSSPNAAPLEQRGCWGGWDQRWFLTWL